jgi:hypothetical protein
MLVIIHFHTMKKEEIVFTESGSIVLSLLHVIQI